MVQRYLFTLLIIVTFPFTFSEKAIAYEDLDMNQGISPQILQALNKLPESTQKQILAAKPLRYQDYLKPYSKQTELTETFPPNIPDLDIPSNDSAPVEKYRLLPQEAPSVEPFDEESAIGEEIVEQPASVVETLYREQYNSLLAEEVEQFGYSFFENPSQITPQLAVPRGNYLLGPGDKLSIRIWGSNIDAAYTSVISPEGTLNVPRIGIVAVAGIPLREIESLLKHEAEKYVQGINIKASLAELRTLEIYIVGEINKPGLHLLPAFSTSLNGLIYGGGIKKSGSLRKIKLFRNGILHKNIDLYSLLLNGNRGTDVTLQHGDLVFVPRLGPTAAVTGAVAQPAIYEINSEKSVADLLNLAGGPLPQSLSGKMLLKRYTDNQEFVVQDITQILSAEIKLQSGDLLELQLIPNNMPQVVYLQGHVWVPDVLAYYDGIKLSNLLTKSDVLRPESIMEFGLIHRYDPATTRYRIEQFPLSKVFSKKFDTDLNPFDKVIILSNEEFGIVEPIKIGGAVWIEGEYGFNPGLTLIDLCSMAGGFKFDADKSRIDLSRQQIINGQVQTVHHVLNIGQNPDFKLQPYDYVVVRSLKEATEFKNFTISGEVLYPGTYRIRDGEKLSDVIKRAGGFTKRSYLYGAIFTSAKAREIQQLSIDKMIDDLEFKSHTTIKEQLQFSDDAVSLQEHQTALTKMVERLRSVKAKGRMTISLAPLSSLLNSKLDFEVKNGDSIIIPERPNFISVVGSVYSPNTFLYNSNKDFADYLSLAGGFTKTADDNGVYILKANGETLKVSSSAKIFTMFDRIHLMPGDTIIVPEDIDRLPHLKLFKEVTDIVFKIATTAGVALSL